MEENLRDQLRDCLVKVAEESGLGKPGDWTIREYDHLSGLLEEKTKIRISSSTLKRLYKGTGASRPQVSTLNALARFIGYRDWYAFSSRGSNIKSPETHQKRNNILSGNRIIGLVIILTGIILYLFWPDKKEIIKGTGDEIPFKAETLMDKGVPNTVTFSYDLTGIKYDSAYITEKWWYEDIIIPIEKSSSKSSKVYYYPGLHNMSLVVDGIERGRTNFRLFTDGWMALVYKNFNDTRPGYLVNEGKENGLLLYVSPEQISKKGFDLTDQHIVSYCNFRDFGNVDGDNFKVKAKLRSSIGEGGQTCQHAWLNIVGENGEHYVALVDPACLGLVDVKFSEYWKKGTDEDLSSFGCDLDNWHDLQIRVSNKLARVTLDGSEIYQAEYNKPVGRIYGIHIQFFGTGAVDFIGLYDDENRPVLINSSAE